MAADGYQRKEPSDLGIYPEKESGRIKASVLSGLEMRIKHDVMFLYFRINPAPPIEDPVVQTGARQGLHVTISVKPCE